MTSSQLEAIRRQIEEAATDPAKADATVLLGIARDTILPLLGERKGRQATTITPAAVRQRRATERSVLVEVAQVLLSDECQHRLVSWRMRGAQTALNHLNRITIFGVD